MQTNRENRAALLAKVAGLILDTIRESPDGAPASALYLALAQHGATYEQFTTLMSILESNRLVTCEHHVYHAISG